MSLIVGGVVLTGAVLAQQQRGEARQATADRATGVVTEHSDDRLSIRIRIDDRADQVWLPVLDTAHHPAGQRLGLFVDSTGFVQLISEPYDVTPWLALPLSVAAVGWALRRRGIGTAAHRREFLAIDQPTSRVYVRFLPYAAAVYAADAQPGDPAALVIRGPWLRPGIDTDDGGPGIGPYLAPPLAPEEVPPTVPGVLRGLPVPGAWCLVEADNDMTLPVVPASSGVAYALRDQITARVPWRDVDRIERRGRMAILHIGDREIPLIAFALTGQPRGAARLADALRYARAHGLERDPPSSGDLPELPPRQPARVSWLLFLVYAPLLAGLLTFASNAT